MLVANCRSGIDPSAGDQSGNEWRLQQFFVYGWNCVLRHPDYKVCKLISNYARHAAQNDNCGYSQANRFTFWNELKSLTGEKDPRNIHNKCDADCSSSTAAIIKAVGYTVGDERLKSVNESLTTFNMRDELLQVGFIEFNGNEILNGYGLNAGDIILNESCHVIIAVADNDYDIEYEPVEVESGEDAETQHDTPVGEPIYIDLDDESIVPDTADEKSCDLITHICRPSENSWFVWAMQYLLKEHKYYTVQATGIFDTLCCKAFIKFQKEHNLEPDCQCGELSWAELTQGLVTMIGDEGEMSFIVKALQYLLRAQGYYIGDGDADGIFGVQLYNQVVRFQRERGLTQNGIVDEKVWNELVKEWVYAN